MTKLVPTYEPKEGKKCNLASGARPLPGFDNYDIMDHPEVIKTDLFQLPWPIPSNTYDYLFCSHFLEHVPHSHNGIYPLFIRVIQEINRICKNGALVEILLPMPSFTMLAYPDHTRIVTVKSFCKEQAAGRYIIEQESYLRTGQWHIKKYLGITIGPKTSQLLLFRMGKPDEGK